MPMLSECGLGWLVRIDADHGLQHRCADLVCQCDRADLHEIQLKLALHQRIDRDDQRLDHVVEKVRKADRAQDPEARLGKTRYLPMNCLRSSLPWLPARNGMPAASAEPLPLPY